MTMTDTYDTPNPINFDWFPNSKSWGRVWAISMRAEPKHERAGFRGWIVIAGLGGAMQGVIVCHGLPTEKSSVDFARDFEQGKVFCTSAMGASLWEELVDAAWSVRKFSVDTKIHLKSLSREWGIIPNTSFKVNRSNLLETYCGGETIGDVVEIFNSMEARR